MAFTAKKLRSGGGLKRKEMKKKETGKALKGKG
jgi:hypothetical protein